MTNVLADEAVRRNKVEDAKAAIEVVVNNKAAIAEVYSFSSLHNVTAQQINTQLSRLNDSILAVYNDLKAELERREFWSSFGCSRLRRRNQMSRVSEINASNHTGKDTSIRFQYKKLN